MIRLTIIQYISNWFFFRIYLYLKIFRPKNLIIEGKINIDFFSIICFDKTSSIFIGDNCSVAKSRLKINNSSFHVGVNSKFIKAKVKIDDSNVKIGSFLIVKNTNFNLSNSSDFFGGNYNLFNSVTPYTSGIYCNQSKIRFGNNVNNFANISCKLSVFETGDNIFFNEGTQIRCHCKITLGNNILISYECIIFDTNTHSLDYRDRAKEMEDGFPNDTIQIFDSEKKVKKAPIIIGDDVWIGMRTTILKGSKIGNRVIIGTSSVIAGLTIDDDKKVVQGLIRII